MSNQVRSTDETLGNLCRRYIAAYKAMYQVLGNASNPCPTVKSPWEVPWMRQMSDLAAAHIDVVRAFSAYPGAGGLVQDEAGKLWRFGEEFGLPMDVDSIVVLRLH